jgi:predicted nucleic acid-binding protein
VAEYLLDTNALVDFLYGIEDAVELIETLSEDRQTIAICSVSVAELFSGLADVDKTRVEGVLTAFEYWDISLTAAKLAGAYRYEFARRGIQLATPDTLQAALAVERDAHFVTGNVRDFPMPDLKIVTYPARG